MSELHGKAHVAYTMGYIERAEESFLKVLELNGGKDYNGAKNNLAYMKRRGETKATKIPVFELLEVNEETVESAFRCINTALCYIQGFECEKNWKEAIQILLQTKKDVDAAYSWWSNYAVVGEAESNLVIYLLSKTKLIAGEPENILQQRLISAKSDFVVPENIEEMIDAYIDQIL